MSRPLLRDLMMDNQPAQDTASPTLGQSYEALLYQSDWQPDLPPDEEKTVAAVVSATPPSPLRIVEALLFIGGAPLTPERACEIVRGLKPDQFQETIDTLNQFYRRQGRPYLIGPQGKGFVLTLRPRFRSVLDKLYGATREARLSATAIDVLALVAYRQPATKQEIDNLRGYESGAVLRQLVRRGLVAIVQRGDAKQREVTYGTTSRFLKMFGLASLEDLPKTQDLQQL